MKTVIIGGGTAGISVATGLRRLDENAEIVVLEKGGDIASSVSGLLAYLDGNIKDLDQLRGATPEQMRQIFRVNVKTECEVVNIDRENKTLTVSGQEEAESYDQLVLATGAMTHRPDIKGILRDNIYTLSDLGSAQKIRDYFLGIEACRVLIVGAGELGVNAAQAFRRLGGCVTLVEAGPHILPSFDEDMTALLQNHLRESGIRLKVNSLVTEFGEKTASLDDDSEIEYDMALITTGTKPDLRLPIMADLEIAQSGGIWVNDRLQTSDPDIYACGDNIELTDAISGESMRWPSASLALKQARTVAENLAGGERFFGPAVGTSILNISGYQAGMCGMSESQLRDYGLPYLKLHLLQDAEACFCPDARQMIWKLMISPDGKILGAQGVGKSGIFPRLNLITEIIKKGGGTEDLLQAEVAYDPAFSAAKDAINNLGALGEKLAKGKIRYSYTDELDWSEAGNEIMLIDTRSPAGFKAGHIAQAVNLPLANLRENLASVPRDRPVILYCGQGYGAYLAFCILNQRGYTNVSMLSGSMDLYMEIALNDIYNEHDDEDISIVWNRLQLANDDEAEME